MRHVIGGVALATMIAGPALAAEPPPIAPPPAPVYNWTGIYVGLNGGGGWGQQDPFNIITNRFDHASINFSGGTVGGTAGAQLQISHVVMGFETDLDWAGITGTQTLTPSINGIAVPFTFRATTDINYTLTARGRVGYAVDNWMFFVTGGLALIGAKTTATGVLGGNPCNTVSIIGGQFTNLSCNGTNNRVGATLGAGVEYGITPAISAKLEYRYTAAASLELSHVNEFLVGLNYRFGGL